MSLKIINTQQISSEFRKLNIIPIYVHLNKSSFIPTVKASGFLSQHHMQNRAQLMRYADTAVTDTVESRVDSWQHKPNADSSAAWCPSVYCQDLPQRRQKYLRRIRVCQNTVDKSHFTRSILQDTYRSKPASLHKPPLDQVPTSAVN